MKSYQAEKKLMRAYMEKMEKCSYQQVQQVLDEFVAADYTWEGVYPFMELKGTKDVAEQFWQPLKKSLTCMQRRQDVFMAGTADDQKTWVMSMGYFMGLFDQEFLGIRPTGKMHHLQYAEWACFEDGKITYSGMIVDLIAFMVEAGVNPLPPSTGHYFIYPGPKDHNGLLFEDAPYEKAAISKQIVEDMIQDLYSINSGFETPPEMLRKSWTEDMIWYGPCGVGASYTIPRYQEQHQKPFRHNLADKSRDERGKVGYFAEGDFVCFIGGMNVRPLGGWLGLPGGAGAVHLRPDIDIYYIKDGKISENWCYFDIPYWLKQQGVDILDRTRKIANPCYSQPE